ncbi:hypothetical protein EJB05_15553, partial [Eragrostis curvula]
MLGLDPRNEDTGGEVQFDCRVGKFNLIQFDPGLGGIQSTHVDNNSFTPRLITPKEKKGREDKGLVGMRFFEWTLSLSIFDMLIHV